MEGCSSDPSFLVIAFHEFSGHLNLGKDGLFCNLLCLPACLSTFMPLPAPQSPGRLDFFFCASSPKSPRSPAKTLSFPPPKKKSCKISFVAMPMFDPPLMALNKRKKKL